MISFNKLINKEFNTKYMHIFYAGITQTQTIFCHHIQRVKFNARNIIIIIKATLINEGIDTNKT